MKKKMFFFICITFIVICFSSCNKNEKDFLAEIKKYEVESEIEKPASLFDHTLPIAVDFQSETISLEEVNIFKDLSSDEETFNYYAQICFDVSGLSNDLFNLLVNEDDMLKYCVSITGFSSNNVDFFDIYFDNMGATIDGSNMIFYLSTVKSSIDLPSKCDVELLVKLPNDHNEFYNISSTEILKTLDMSDEVAGLFNEYFENDPRYIWEDIETNKYL